MDFMARVFGLGALASPTKESIMSWFATRGIPLFVEKPVELIDFKRSNIKADVEAAAGGGGASQESTRPSIEKLQANWQCLVSKYEDKTREIGTLQRTIKRKIALKGIQDKKALIPKIQADAVMAVKSYADYHKTRIFIQQIPPFKTSLAKVLSELNEECGQADRNPDGSAKTFYTTTTLNKYDKDGTKLEGRTTLTTMGIMEGLPVQLELSKSLSDHFEEPEHCMILCVGSKEDIIKVCQDVQSKPGLHGASLIAHTYTEDIVNLNRILSSIKIWRGASSSSSIASPISCSSKKLTCEASAIF